MKDNSPIRGGRNPSVLKTKQNKKTIQLALQLHRGSSRSTVVRGGGADILLPLKTSVVFDGMFNVNILEVNDNVQARRKDADQNDGFPTK